MTTTTNNRNYSSFNLIVDFSGKFKFFSGIVATDLESAIADIFAAYGEGILVQWGIA